MTLESRIKWVKFVKSESPFSDSLPHRPMLKLFGLADLGLVQQRDGVLSTYANEPLSITGDNSQVSVLYHFDYENISLTASQNTCD